MRRHSQAGFTLIELMVAISVLAILLSAAVPSFRQFVANTQIRSTAQSILNGLQTARAEAVKRNATVAFTLNISDTSWAVGCPTATANCPTNIQSKPAKEGSSSSVTLAKTGTNTISFSNLGNATTTAGQLSRVDIDYTPASVYKKLSITIGAGGNARLCDPSISVTSDPRFCS